MIARRSLGCIAALLAASACSPHTEPNAATALDANLQFIGVDGAPHRLAEYAPGAGNSSELLVLRVVAGWCGTCRWSSSHTSALFSAAERARLAVVDVIVANDQNAPPGTSDLERWQNRSDGLGAVVGDPAFQLRSLFAERSALPLLAFVDARSLAVLETLTNPSPEQVTNAAAATLARIRNESPPKAVEPALHDGRFTQDQWDLISAMALPATAPPDTSSAFADDPNATELGRKLFFDGSLSPTGVSCSSCHAPALLFTDGKETPPEGAGPNERNAPTVLLAGDQPAQFWDGRADSLWMQALAPFESPVEFGSSRLFAVNAVFQRYRAEYEATFGSLQAFEGGARFPKSGGPGEAAWEALSATDQDVATRAFVNVGKAIAAYERSLRPAPSPLDAYARGDLTALTDDEKDGLLAFFQAGCAECHYGPRLTDDSFHNLRFPTGRHDRTADVGRRGAATSLAESAFNRGGRFSDDPTSFAPPKAEPTALGAFKTPGLRGVAYTLPHGHGGSFWGLTSVIEAIQTGGLPSNSTFSAGELDPFLPTFDAALTPRIIPFLKTLRVDVSP